MKKHPSIYRLVVVTFGLLLLFASGCGSGNQDSPIGVDGAILQKSSIASCLKASGAQVAETKKDLHFFIHAQSEGTATKFGFLYDKKSKIWIQQWEDGYDPRTWLMWAGQPLGEDRTPVKIINEPAQGAYVAYALRPTVAERRSFNDCMEQSIRY